MWMVSGAVIALVGLLVWMRRHPSGHAKEERKKLTASDRDDMGSHDSIGVEVIG